MALHVSYRGTGIVRQPLQAMTQIAVHQAETVLRALAAKIVFLVAVTRRTLLLPGAPTAHKHQLHAQACPLKCVHSAQHPF